MNQSPANWYSDPAKRHELRYWDGIQWTDHVISNQAQSIDPLYPPTAGLSADHSSLTTRQNQPLQPSSSEASETKPQLFNLDNQNNAMPVQFATGATPHYPNSQPIVPSYGPIENSVSPAPYWHPDPTQRHDMRYWDGTQWTDHVISQQQQWIDPLYPNSTPHTQFRNDEAVPPQTSSNGHVSDNLGTPLEPNTHATTKFYEFVPSNPGHRANLTSTPAEASPELIKETKAESKPKPKKKFAKQVKRAEIGKTKWEGGGTLLTESVLVVNQKATRFDFVTEYTIFDRNGTKLGVARESETNGFFSIHPSATRKRIIEIRDPEGSMIYKLVRPAKIVKPRVDLFDSEDHHMGTFAQNSMFSRNITLEHSQGVAGTIYSRDHAKHRFDIADATERKIASISRTWAGRRAERKTRADNYVIEINEPTLPEPVLGFTIASAIIIDLLFQEGDPSDEDTSIERENRGFWL